MAKVLIVEDNPLLRENLSELLQYKGFVTQEAGDGKQAWQAILDGGIDLILSDIDMPEMNGLELLKSVKSTDLYSGIPFILMSGNSDFSLISKAKSLGAEALFSKPFPISKLEPWLLKDAMAS